MISPLHDLYYGRRAVHSGTRGSLILPETSREAYFDSTILAAGPGRINARGETVPMQADVGDRVLCDPAAFQHYEPGVAKPTCGFVRDRNILCVVRGPEYLAVEPAADWLLVDPDPRAEEVTASGVVVVSNSLAGDEARRKERSYELMSEYERLLHSPRYREQPTPFDQFRIEGDFIENLSRPDYECFAPLLRKVREKAVERPGASLAELLGDGEEWEAEAPLRLSEKVTSGVVLGIGPDCRTDAELSDRVRWSRFHSAVRLSVAGALRLLVPSNDLEAII